MSETPDGIVERLKPEAVARLIEHHRLDCSRMVHGRCSTRRCLVRGGWVAGDGTGYDKATCEALETCRALEAAAEITALRAQLAVKDKALREALPNHRCEYCGDEALDPHPCRMSSGHSWKPLNTGSQS